jgi:hypothetical protein
VKKKPARKPAKKRPASPANEDVVAGRLVQQALFSSGFRPAFEVRAAQEREVLAGNVPRNLIARLVEQAAEILTTAQRYEMDQSTKPHRYSWGPGKKHFYTAEASVLHDLVEQIAAIAFRTAADRYRPEIAALVARLEKQTRLLEQRRENGELLAAEGRAAKKSDDDRRADRVCKLYSRIRPTHPTGKRGNGAALEAVSRQSAPLTGRGKPLTKQAIRKILKRRGIPCR